LHLLAHELLILRVPVEARAHPLRVEICSPDRRCNASNAQKDSTQHRYRAPSRVRFEAQAPDMGGSNEPRPAHAMYH
jgi:hypothetical protein